MRTLRRTACGGWMGSVAVLVLIAVTGCWPAASRSSATITVSPAGTSRSDEALHIVVRGLLPNEKATLQVRSTDGRGTGWASSTTFRADSSGIVDLARAAGLSGSYAGTSEMGPFWSMTPTQPDPAVAYVWPAGRADFQLSVVARSQAVGRVTIQRELPPGKLIQHQETLSSAGFIGDYFEPLVPGRHPAVLYFGGSQGGMSLGLEPGLLARLGYPVLSLAYFKEPGLPASLSNIPLEYFTRALNWLEKQPRVDPSRTIVWGVSRGSEAALLLGADFPSLVHGIVALVPSDASLCSFPGCDGAAWTLRGAPVPFTKEFDNPAPNDDPAAVIPVERIQGPILLGCGGADEVWLSCPYSDAIVSRLKANGRSDQTVLYKFPDAGHYIADPLPWWPLAPRFSEADVHYAANQAVRGELWADILAFLSGLGAQQ